MMGYRDWLTSNTQMASTFLDLGGINFRTRCQILTLHSSYGANASLIELLLLLLGKHQISELTLVLSLPFILLYFYLIFSSFICK